jgi:hypothetical protein
MSHVVFVSYSSHDKTIADEACRALETKGIPCWIAPRDVLPGSLWGEEIINAINDSQIMVLILSSSSNDSPQVIREIERAGSKGLPIISFRIGDVRLSKSMEYFVSTHHWLDATKDPLESCLTRLVETAQTLLSAKDTGSGRSDNRAERPALGGAWPKRARVRTWGWILVAAAVGIGGSMLLTKTKAPVSPPPQESKSPAEEKAREDVGKASTGQIEIETTPSGAEVRVDDQMSGTTPFRKTLPSGPHRISLKKGAEYREVTDLVNVEPGGVFSKAYTLEAQFVLKITTKPDEAEVFIDDAFQGRTPLTMTRAANAGKLRIVKGPEWSEIQDQLRLAPGVNTLQYALERRAHRISVQTMPAGAQVWVDDEAWGVSPVTKTLLAGQHRIRIIKTGYRILEEPLGIESDFEKNFVLEKLLAGKVSLRVQPFAEVFVDGKPLGEVPPQRSCDLEEGKHVFEFVSSRINKKVSVEIEVKSGGSQEIRVNMDTGEYQVVRLFGPEEM